MWCRQIEQRLTLHTAACLILKRRRRLVIISVGRYSITVIIWCSFETIYDDTCEMHQPVIPFCRNKATASEVTTVWRYINSIIIIIIIITEE